MDPDASSGRDHTTWALIAAGVLVWTLASIAANPLAINGDSALHIQAAERILQGGAPHVDAIDTNPPLIMYLTAVPTAVAHATGVHPVPVFLLTIWSFTAISIFLARGLLLALPRSGSQLHANLLAVALALAAHAVYTRLEYGQREHLFVFGVIPYLIVRFRSWEGLPASRAAAIVTGAAAGIATAIKPQFALIVLAPEAYWYLAHRTLRPLLRAEVSAAVAAVALYLAHFLLWPAVGQAWFGRWVPMLIGGFAAYNGTLEAVFVLHLADWLPAIVAAIPFGLSAQPRDDAWRLARPLAISTIAALAVYFLQHKGWTYHAVPIRVLAYALTGLIVAQLVAQANDRVRPAIGNVLSSRWIRFTLALGVGIAIFRSLLIIGPSTQASFDRLGGASAMGQAVAAHSKPGDPVLILTTDAWTVYPLLTQMRRPQASRFLFAFPVPLLYYNGNPNAEAERRFLSELAADVERWKPAMITIDRRPRCMACPEGFSLYDYFDRKGFLAGVLKDYAPAGSAASNAMFVRK